MPVGNRSKQSKKDKQRYEKSIQLAISKIHSEGESLSGSGGIRSKLVQEASSITSLSTIGNELALKEFERLGGLVGLTEGDIINRLSAQNQDPSNIQPFILTPEIIRVIDFQKNKCAVTGIQFIAEPNNPFRPVFIDADLLYPHSDVDISGQDKCLVISCITVPSTGTPYDLSEGWMECLNEYTDTMKLMKTVEGRESLSREETTIRNSLKARLESDVSFLIFLERICEREKAVDAKAGRSTSKTLTSIDLYRLWYDRPRCALSNAILSSESGWNQFHPVRLLPHGSFESGNVRCCVSLLSNPEMTASAFRKVLSNQLIKRVEL